MVYFVLHNNAQEGPYATQDVKRLLREGRYAPGSLCWREGWEEWRPLSSILGLVAKSGESEDNTAPVESMPPGPENEFHASPPAWQQDRTGKVEKRVVGLLVVVLLLGALCIVLALLLIDLRSHIQRETEPTVSRAELEQALIEAAASMRGPQAADEIRTWVTYDEAITGRPSAVARANVLVYPENMVAGIVNASASGGGAETRRRLQSSLPPPWRETITDSNGVASIGDLQPGNYYLIVFAQKTGAAEPEDYFWVAKRQLDGHPSESLVLSEKNATTTKSRDFILIE